MKIRDCSLMHIFREDILVLTWSLWYCSCFEFVDWLRRSRISGRLSTKLSWASNTLHKR